MKKVYGLLNWGFALCAVLLVASACSPDLSEEAAKVNTTELGCLPGLSCEGEGAKCIADQGEGELECVNHGPGNTCDGGPGSSCWAPPGCVEGGYCDSEDDDCVAVDETALFCNVGDNILHEQDCGDGMVDGTEVCDDANEEMCNGRCAADCMALNDRCGDGITCGAEACDDGNDSNEDECSNNCTVPDCGNGITEPGEDCDDGNTENGDTCAANCTTVGCGNGITEPNGRDGIAGTLDDEACDDDNTIQCVGTCTADCKQAVTGCGDGIPCGTEACDDGNENDNDDCTDECTVAVCGDGIVQTGVEECEDGNSVNTDGCTNECMLPVCGDGYVQAGEACDSGDASSDGVMGCDHDCSLSTCGNGVVVAPEGCDDGNVVSTDSCNMCIQAFCGDGIEQPLGADGVVGGGDDEECDDGNSSNGDLCNNECEDQDCMVTDIVPCSEGTYGCFGTSPSTLTYCDPPGGGARLYCSCPNTLDSNRGTWLLANADCGTADLCWDPVDGDTDDDDDAGVEVDAGGAGGVGGAGGTTGGAGGAGGTTGGAGGMTGGTGGMTGGVGGASGMSGGVGGMTGGAGGAAGMSTGGAGGMTGGAGGAGGTSGGTGGAGGTGGGDGLWHFSFSSDEVITGTAEVRVLPAFTQVHTFTTFPTSFTRVTFDPVVNRFVVQWPTSAPANWFCEVMTLQGVASAVSPTGVNYNAVPVSNGMGGCDVGFVVAP